MKKMPEFIVHVSVELADSMVEEKLRYTTNKENKPTRLGKPQPSARTATSCLELSSRN